MTDVRSGIGGRSRGRSSCALVATSSLKTFSPGPRRDASLFYNQTDRKNERIRVLILRSEREFRELASRFGTEHVFRFWEELDSAGKERLLEDLAQIDFPPLMERLADTWVRNTPQAESFKRIEPVPMIPIVDPARPDARAALEAGEEALAPDVLAFSSSPAGRERVWALTAPRAPTQSAASRVNHFSSIALEKILNLQRRYGCVLPWYIMVSQSNGPATRAYFEAHGYFGLSHG